MLRYVVLTVCTMVVSACQSTSPGDLKPKEYLFNASFVDTKSALTSAFADSNYRIASDDDRTVVLDRPSAGSGSADDRVSIEFLGDDPTKVTFSGAAASGSGAFGGGSDTTDTAEFRELVAQAAAKAAADVRRGPTPGGQNQSPETGRQTSSLPAGSQVPGAFGESPGQ